jgi:GNAT superfamily N-acetyltransferase
MASPLLRSAVLDDAADIAELISELGYPTSPDAMRARFAKILPDPDYETLVAQGDRVVGVGGATLDRYYERDGTYSRLVVLAVSSSARGLGIGTGLLEKLESWATRNGAAEMFVNSGLQRAEAHAFYEHQGFTRSGFRFVKSLG